MDGRLSCLARCCSARGLRISSVRFLVFRKKCLRVLTCEAPVKRADGRISPKSSTNETESTTCITAFVD
jgi:hypothetical protein